MNSRNVCTQLAVFVLLAAAPLLMPGISQAQFYNPAKESLSDVYPGKAYSPYAKRSFPSQPAFYYARVLEIPPPLWVAYDAFRFGVNIPEEAETIHQECAYTSPIWYSP